MQQCDMCHPPPASQLPLPRSYNGTGCHGIVQTVSMSTHNTPPSHNPTSRSPVSGRPGSGPGRAAQPILQLRAPPRPAPAPARHQTRPFVFIVRPSPAAAPGGSRTPHSHDPTHILQSAGWPACSHRRAPAPPPSPPAGMQLQEVWRGRGGALLEAAQPSPHLAPQRGAGRAGAGTGRTQQQPNNSGEGKSSQKHNPHNFCTPDPPQPGQGAFTGGVGEASLGFTVWGGTFSRVRRNL